MTVHSGVLQTEVLKGGLELECGETVEINYGKAVPVQADAECRDRIVKAADGMGSGSGKAYATGNAEADGITARMWDAIRAAGSLLIRKLVCSAPVIVRFHNDVDGSGGALALYTALEDFVSRNRIAPNVVWIMHRGVSYPAYDALNDVLIANGYSCIEKPLLLIIDFGTTAESNEGIDKLSGIFDIIWLDHHPIIPEFRGAALEHYINPWGYGGNSSYTAGLLASAFSKVLSETDTATFEQASLIGDYSAYANPDDALAQETSTLLDFITSDPEAAYGPSKQNVTPQEIKAVMEDSARKAELVGYANMRMEEAIERGMGSARLHELRGSLAYVLDFDDVRQEGSRYPLPGRFSSKLLSHIGERAGGVAMIVYAGSYVLMRTDKELCARISLLDAVNEIKSRYPDLVENGGGHACACALKLRDKSRTREIATAAVAILKELLEEA